MTTTSAQQNLLLSTANTVSSLEREYNKQAARLALISQKIQLAKDEHSLLQWGVEARELSRRLSDAEIQLKGAQTKLQDLRKEYGRLKTDLECGERHLENCKLYEQGIGGLGGALRLARLFAGLVNKKLAVEECNVMLLEAAMEVEEKTSKLSRLRNMDETLRRMEKGLQHANKEFEIAERKWLEGWNEWGSDGSRSSAMGTRESSTLLNGDALATERDKEAAFVDVISHVKASKRLQRLDLEAMRNRTKHRRSRSNVSTKRQGLNTLLIYALFYCRPPRLRAKVLGALVTTMHWAVPVLACWDMTGFRMAEDMGAKIWQFLMC